MKTCIVVLIVAVAAALAVCPRSLHAQVNGRAAAVPATDPSLADLMDMVDASLRSADADYDKDVAHGKELLTTRMEAAKHVAVNQSQPADIDATCKALLSDKPVPEIGEHHLEAAVAGPAEQIEKRLGPADARAAVLSYQADLELAHKRWLDATAATRQPALRILTEELSRAVRLGNAPLADRLKPMVARLDDAARGTPTAWYREQLVPDASGASPVRQIPIALTVEDVGLPDQFVGDQFKGALGIRTLVAPYKGAPKVIAPSDDLLIYDGDQIVFYAGGAWGGAHDVGAEQTMQLDTHSNVLVAAKGKPFVFAKPGTYTMKLILLNGGGWSDVLDAYKADFNVAPAEAKP